MRTSQISENYLFFCDSDIDTFFFTDLRKIKGRDVTRARRGKLPRGAGGWVGGRQTMGTQRPKSRSANQNNNSTNNNIIQTEKGITISNN
jgi:hypothetical protein